MKQFYVQRTFKEEGLMKKKVTKLAIGLIESWGSNLHD